MPKYDAFGREIGEDTLAGLGGTPRRVEPRPEPVALRARRTFAAALRKLGGSELRLTHLRLAPERIDATLRTRGGRLRHVQVQP